MPCYTPAGKNINTEIWHVNESAIYQPCNTSAAVSMCCAIGPDRVSIGTEDVCIDDGLCHNSVDGDKDQTWRESCTDPTWKDPACVKLFLNGTGINATEGTQLDDNGDVITDVEITNCGLGMWCYGEANYACCRLGQGVYLYNNEQVNFNPASSSVSSSASASAASNATATQSHTSATNSASDAASQSTSSPLAQSVSSSGLSTGAKAGIGVGVALGAILVALLGFWVFRKSRRRQKGSIHELQQEERYKDHPQDRSNSSMLSQEVPAESVAKPKQPYQFPELPSEADMEQRYELSSNTGR